MSTYAVIDILDDALFNPNLACGIVSYSLEHAQHIFKRIIGHALETLPAPVKHLAGILSHSAREISFNNGSFLRVDTSLRGGAYPCVLVSEFGKTCSRSPLKAEEVITGTLQSVPQGGKIIIESTAEGNEGFFAQMCNVALERGNDNLSPLDYYLFFFPWYAEAQYSTPHPITYEIELEDYFTALQASAGIKLTQHQKYWYAAQRSLLGSKLKQEFPSSVGEAFLASSDAYYYATAIEEAYQSNRCLSSSLYDAIAPVYVGMDIGVNDLTVLVFFQVIHGEIRVIDYYEDKNKGVDFYARFILHDKKYIIHTVFLPHDSAHRDGIVVENTYEREFKKFFSHTQTRVLVLKRTDLNLGISHAKIKFDRCVFAIGRVKPLLDHLSKYRKKWSEQYGKYLDEPYHDVHCFTGDTLIETDEGMKRIDAISIGEKVKTPSGYKSVKNKFQYQSNNLLKISYGLNSLTCTPHHKIFTQKGLSRADSLRYDIQLLTIKDESIWKEISYRGEVKGLGFKDYFLSMNQQQLSILMAQDTNKINLDIGEAMECCTERYGLTIMGKYLKGMMCIIAMKINQIMKLITYLLFQEVSISECICVPMKERIYQEEQLQMLKKKQKFGIAPSKVSNGIRNMALIPSKIKSGWKNFVKYAEQNINHLGQSLNDVQMSVGQNIGEFQESTTKRDSASSVRKNLSVTSMQKRKHVLEVVPLFLDSKIEVYDIEVEGDNCYFANTILVSNSNYADAFRYSMQGVTHVETLDVHSGALEKHKKVVDNRRTLV